LCDPGPRRSSPGRRTVAFGRRTVATRKKQRPSSAPARSKMRSCAPQAPPRPRRLTGLPGAPVPGAGLPGLPACWCCWCPAGWRGAVKPGFTVALLPCQSGPLRACPGTRGRQAAPSCTGVPWPGAGCGPVVAVRWPRRSLAGPCLPGGPRRSQACQEAPGGPRRPCPCFPDVSVFACGAEVILCPPGRSGGTGGSRARRRGKPFTNFLGF
jgi:hypothetical protein